MHSKIISRSPFRFDFILHKLKAKTSTLYNEVMSFDTVVIARVYSDCIVGGC